MRRLRYRIAALAALPAIVAVVAALDMGSDDPRTSLVIQRFFGACEAEYSKIADVARASGECGIMTAIINRFEAQNPDIEVKENIVFWPGYDQLTAQLAANDAPDLVTMHASVLADYQARGLIEPLNDAVEQIGINADDFTDTARAAVTIDEQIYGTPIDTWAPLFHINMNLFAEADLVENGEPVLPSNPQELLAQAEQFRERTGLPYFVQATANEYASFARNFYTFLLQQGADIFPTPRKISVQNDAARNVLALFKAIHDRDLTTKNQDYSAAVAGFMKGDGGVFLVGTWMIDTFEAASKKETGALSGGYCVMPYPQLFDTRHATYADGHVWAMPVDPTRTPAERDAALRFLRFFSAHAFDWSRTGHLPAFKHVIASPAWQALPHRESLAVLSTTGTSLPKGLRRQFPIETIIGQEAAAAISGAKSIDRALADMERRVNDILNHI